MKRIIGIVPKYVQILKQKLSPPSDVLTATHWCGAKKKCLFPSEHPGEIFFLIVQPVISFQNNKCIKKILNRKRKLKKKRNKNVYITFKFCCVI